jgi:2-succinyl-5-enolpyruvyl-6-hydroxy-3-cyclohexene-1-carboxylate synthase
MQSADVTATFCATLVDEWFESGIRHAVVAPGSRSTPMALALVAHPGLDVQVFHDERSAAFAALGIAKVTGVPTLLLCTSGTATANFHPAVMEASHAEVPLLVLTADRPPELQGVGAPQTTDQQRLYGSSVRLFVDAGVPDDTERHEWRAVARRAYVAAIQERPGPVQMNLPFREPLVGAVAEVPSRTDPSRDGASRTMTKNVGRMFAATAKTPLGTETLSKLSTRLSGRRGTIVAGARGGSSPKIFSLARRLGWPVLADPLGGCRDDDELSVRHADGWLRDASLAERFTPEVVLRFGALPASKVINTWLRECGAEIVAVGMSPFLIDPDRRVSLHVVTDPDVMCDDLCNLVDAADAEWSRTWGAAELRARDALAAAMEAGPKLSEPQVARTVADAIPRGSNLVVSSSMPIRDLEWYAGATSGVRVFANRGVNGIDGVVSTAVGIALGSHAPTTLLIGDVAFLHDSNGLLNLVNRGVDVRIVVVDNRGGGIFSFLPQRSTLQERQFEQLFGTPHSVDIGGFAAAHGVSHRVVATVAELRGVLATPGPHVVIVRTDRTENVLEHERLNRAIIDAVRADTPTGG